MSFRARAFVLLLAALAVPSPRRLPAQQTAAATARDYSKEQLVVEQLAYTVQFENDGTYKGDTSARVRVLSAAGVQQAGLIQFPYASLAGNATISGVKVTKPDGTVVETPSDS